MVFKLFREKQTYLIAKNHINPHDRKVWGTRFSVFATSPESAFAQVAAHTDAEQEWLELDSIRPMAWQERQILKQRGEATSELNPLALLTLLILALGAVLFFQTRAARSAAS